jgi:pimeloyl-ACP methyl ester carboxylesterase
MSRRLLLRVTAIAVLLLALLLLVGPFLVPVPPTAASAAPEELAGPNSRFVDVPFAGDTLTVHYEEAGEGEPTLMLLHGFASSTYSWREVLSALGESARTIAFDRPAFGLTERPLPETWQGDWQSENPYRPGAQGELTAGLLDQLGIDKAVLVGNSAGGSAAMLTALAYPERVEALILINPAVYNSGGRSPLLRWLANTPQMRHLGPLIARQVQGWGLDFARSAWHDPSRLDDTIWAGYQLPLGVADWDRALWEYTAAGTPSDLPARLAELDLPVLVIAGDDDRIVPTAESMRLAEELPNAQLVVIPACGHVPHEECPQAVLDAVHEFLTSLGAAKGSLLGS